MIDRGWRRSNEASAVAAENPLLRISAGNFLLGIRWPAYEAPLPSAGVEAGGGSLASGVSELGSEGRFSISRIRG